MRSLDFVLGAPLVGVVGTLRKRRPLPSDPRRIAVLQPTAVGDAILSSGVLAQLGRAYPGAAVTVFHGPSNGAAMPLIAAQFQSQTCSFSEPWAVARALRDGRFDIVVDLAPWPRSTALIAAYAGAVTVGFDSEGQYRASAFDVAVPHSATLHEFENHARIAELFGAADGYKMEIQRGNPAPDFPLPYDRLVLFHSQPGGSRAKDRLWPSGHWAELARRCSADGLAVAFTGSGVDKAVAQALVEETGLPADRAFSLAGRVDLRTLAGILERARLLVSVDTGILHLGAALGMPVIGLHGPSRAARWGGYSPQTVGIDSPWPGAGITKFGFERVKEGPAMMAAITVDRVHAAARQQLLSHAPALTASGVTSRWESAALKA
jgi:ADP-heptose:LPS heptosyltransferase